MPDNYAIFVIIDGKTMQQNFGMVDFLQLKAKDKTKIEKAKADSPFANFSQGIADKLSFENNTFDFAFSIMSLLIFLIIFTFLDIT